MSLRVIIYLMERIQCATKVFYVLQKRYMLTRRTSFHGAKYPAFMAELKKSSKWPCVELGLY